MRLLYVIHQFFPDCHSGTEQYCLAMAQEARRRGDEVTVLSLHWDYGRSKPAIELFEQPYDGFRVLRLNHWLEVNPNGELRDYENLHLEGWFRRVLDDVRPDAVHFFHLRQLGSHLIPLTRRLGVRAVVSLTDFWFLCPRFTLLRRDGGLCEGPPDGGRGCVACDQPELLAATPDAGRAAAVWRPGARLRALLDRPATQRENLRHADAVFAPSRFLAAMFARNGFDHPRMAIVPYGLAPGRIAPVPAARPRTPLRLGFCGVLSPWKAPHLAIAAVKQVRAPVELTIHGRLEEPMFADYIASLQAAAADDPRIRFAGPYGAAEASRVFAAMDVLLTPSTWYENTPFVVLEAFAAGVPVIASDLGGLSEVVNEDRNGALFTAGDESALAAAIERVAARTNWFDAAGFGATPSNADGYARFRAAYAGA